MPRSPDEETLRQVNGKKGDSFWLGLLFSSACGLPLAFRLFIHTRENYCFNIFGVCPPAASTSCCDEAMVWPSPQSPIATAEVENKIEAARAIKDVAIFIMSRSSKRSARDL